MQFGTFRKRLLDAAAGARSKWLASSSRARVVAVAAVAVLVTSSVVAADGSLLGADGTYRGCAGNNGVLRVLQPGESCKSNETAISWNQMGPMGPMGPQGPQGPQGLKGDNGAPGPAGTVSLASLAGTACTRADSSAGTVAFKVNTDNTIALTCGTPGTWCDANTPPVGPHMTANCNNDSHQIFYSCEQGWTDTNGNPADGCEEIAGGPQPLRYDGVAMNWLSASGLMFSGTDTVTVPADCGSNLDAACPGGVATSPLPTMTADMNQRAGDFPRTTVQSDMVNSRYLVTARFRLKTDTAIPVTLPGGAQCGLSFDTTRGSSPDLVVTFHDNVVNPDGPTQISDVSVSGLENADYSLSGDFLCNITSTFSAADIYPTLTYALTPWLGKRGALCGAADPVYFVSCPAN